MSIKAKYAEKYFQQTGYLYCSAPPSSLIQGTESGF